MSSGHRNILLFGILAIGGCLLALTGATVAHASPNTVDVTMKIRMSHTSRFPTAVVMLRARNNTENVFSAVGHMEAIEDGVPYVPTVLTFPFRFDGAKPDLHWHMPLTVNGSMAIKFKVRVTARKRYCLKVRLDVSYVYAPKGGSAQARACVNVRS